MKKNIPLPLMAAFLIGIPTAGFCQGAGDPFSDEPVKAVNVQTTTSDALPDVPEVSSGQEQTQSLSQSYSVKAGDTLCKIAGKFLGDPGKFWEIVKLNAGKYPSLLKNPNLIFVGWKLILPGEGAKDANSAGQLPADQIVTQAPKKISVSGTTDTSLTSSLPTKTQTTVSEKNKNDEIVQSPRQAGEPLINENTRVLHIGDSHTVGVYGNEMDAMMRKTGAKVQTYGVAGSSPSWWWKGTTTKCGYVGKTETGKTDRPADWRTPRQTPILKDLIKGFQPGVIVISLGANLIGANAAAIEAQVDELFKIAQENGAQIVWVGPPRSRETPEQAKRKDALCEALQRSVVRNGGTFVDSRPFTQYPENGGDGLHYGGTEGTKIAKSWANNVFNQVQQTKPKN